MVATPPWLVCFLSSLTGWAWRLLHCLETTNCFYLGFLRQLEGKWLVIFLGDVTKCPTEVTLGRKDMTGLPFQGLSICHGGADRTAPYATTANQKTEHRTGSRAGPYICQLDPMSPRFSDLPQLGTSCSNTWALGDMSHPSHERSIVRTNLRLSAESLHVC